MRLALALPAALTAVLVACTVQGSNNPQQTPKGAVEAVEQGYGTCHYIIPTEAAGNPDLVLPDPRCTPGASNNETQAQACAKEPPRPDLSQVKLVLLVKYGQAKTQAQAKSIASHYELDHFIPRWTGGTDGEANLWPEPHPTPNAKDGLEWHQRDLVCKSNTYPGGVAQARVDMVTNWVALWIKLGKPSTTATISD